MVDPGQINCLLSVINCTTGSSREKWRGSKKRKFLFRFLKSLDVCYSLSLSNFLLASVTVYERDAVLCKVYEFFFFSRKPISKISQSTALLLGQGQNDL